VVDELGEAVVLTRLAGTAGAALVVALAGLSGAGVAVADTPPFDGTASAYAFVAEVANPQAIPLGLSPEVDGPTAQSRLSSVQQSDSFAAAPYLGEAVTGLPGLAGSLFGVQLPAYPLIVSTSFGDEPAEKTFGGIALQARSELMTAESRAVGGNPSSGSSSNARVAATDSGVKATADARYDGLEVSGALSIGSVRATASASRDLTGALTTTSSLKVADLSVPGLRLPVPECTPKSVPVPLPGIPPLPELPEFCVAAVPVVGGAAGTVLESPRISLEGEQATVSLPSAAGVPPVSFQVPVKRVLDALALAGVQATYSAPRPLTGADGRRNGIAGAVLTLKTVLPEAPAPVNGQVPGETTLSMTFGRVAAQVDLAGLLEPAPVEVPQGSLDGGGVAAGPFEAGTPGVPGTSGELPPLAAAGPLVPAAAPRLAPLPLRSVGFASLDMRDIYLAVAASAVIVLLSSAVLRQGGVRSV
jgi:hypothetical protein